MTSKKMNSHVIFRMPVAVDLVILTVTNDQLAVLLIQRGIEPFKGRWALPGGFVRQGEDLQAAALRELTEETGIKASKVGHIEQLASFGQVDRDPRERVLSVAYLAFVPDLPKPVAGGDAGGAEIVPMSAVAQSSEFKLAFDHSTILNVGIERTRAKLEYTSLAARFCGKQFTIQSLRKVYEAVWGHTLDPANFHRKVTKTDGFVVATESAAQGGSGRPAQLFTKGDAEFLYPPLMRT
jgi:8-oxo-dGTP diphosphatase